MQNFLPTRHKTVVTSFAAALSIVLLAMFCMEKRLTAASDRDTPNPGLVTELSAPVDHVLQAVEEVLQDQTIHGTLMFDREPTLTGAIAVESTPLFGPWKGEGQVFYKIRKDAIAPRHFRASADRGTIAVRYVVTSVSPERTRLRIDAIFVETVRRTTHPSDGTVESSESRAIQDHLQVIQAAEQQAVEAERRRESADLATQTLIRQREDDTALLAAAGSSVHDLEQRIDSLQHEIERRIKEPGASLKASPFRSAADLAHLPTYTQVVILIVTPHWYGVETPNGQHGWLPIDQLEPLP
ncbi:MAG: hypothetical protein DMG41_29305 [Acidobacteria bacterium]|nr:MAG: hypothetical protein AUH13_09440 [Acidobacteria bacterium 13_2_20CM_58_27]PYT76573.1 MAG: hypothetical protein DMG42_04750 [Acidobacteriota bacterium]PYT83930.1 MAG: hypothetical protein DMG41_29305 [Acidobacteriota bacterium]